MFYNKICGSKIRSSNSLLFFTTILKVSCLSWSFMILTLLIITCILFGGEVIYNISQLDSSLYFKQGCYKSDIVFTSLLPIRQTIILIYPMMHVTRSVKQVQDQPPCFPSSLSLNIYFHSTKAMNSGKLFSPESCYH